MRGVYEFEETGMLGIILKMKISPSPPEKPSQTFLFL
jgi:hypothetical protein